MWLSRSILPKGTMAAHNFKDMRSPASAPTAHSARLPAKLMYIMQGALIGKRLPTEGSLHYTHRDVKVGACRSVRSSLTLLLHKHDTNCLESGGAKSSHNGGTGRRPLADPQLKEMKRNENSCPNMTGRRSDAAHRYAFSGGLYTNLPCSEWIVTCPVWPAAGASTRPTMCAFTPKDSEILMTLSAVAWSV